MGSRFKFQGKNAMRPMKARNGKKRGAAIMLAYFNVIDTETGLEYKDCRLFSGEHGPFVKSPFRSYEADGETKYQDLWAPAYDAEARNKRNADGQAFMDELAEAAARKYKEVTKGSANYSDDDDDEEDDRPAPRRSGRGPIGGSRRRNDDDEDERPARSTRGRPRADDGEDEDDEDTPPRSRRRPF